MILLIREFVSGLILYDRLKKNNYRKEAFDKYKEIEEEGLTDRYKSFKVVEMADGIIHTLATYIEK